MDAFVATKRSIWLAGTIVTLALLSPPVMAVDFEGVGVEQRQKRAEATQNFIDGLQVTKGQARDLMPIVAEAAQLQIEAYRLEAEYLPTALEAYGDLLEEDRLDMGFSREVEERAARINHKVRELRDSWSEDLRQLEEEALQLLDEEQLAFVENWRPPFAPQGRPEDPLHQGREKLDELRRNKHPRAGPLGEHLLDPSAFAIVADLAGQSASPEMVDAATIYKEGTTRFSIEERDDLRRQVRRLRTEINNWNLINGLHLTEDQIGQITGTYQGAVAESPRPETVLALPVRRGPAPPPIPRYLLRQVEEEVEAVLTNSQRQVLENYSPCLIPPMNLKDPVRVGQANDTGKLEMWLERARMVPEFGQWRLVELALERESEHFGPLSEAEAEARRGLLLHTIEEVAAMDDTTFELEKADIAARIGRQKIEIPLRNEVVSMGRERGHPGLVAQFMLNDQFVEQLTQRSRQLAAGEVVPRVDPTSGPRAENCDKNCAVED